MSASVGVMVAIGLPLLGAILVQLFGKWPNLRDGALLLVAAVTFGVVCWTTGQVLHGEEVSLTFFRVLPGLTMSFHAEPLGILFSLVASGLWVPTTAYAIGYMRGHHEENQTRFFTCFSLAITGALGVAYAENLITLFIFYEFLTLSTYPLVTHHQTEKSKRAGRVYMGILLSTSICGLLAAVLYTYHLTGTTDFEKGGILAEAVASGAIAPEHLKWLLAFFAFGTGKAALVPFHRWLPNAMVAPTPVSALLHAVAVVKAGVFTVTKVVVYTFGVELLHETGASVWLTYMAAFTILFASSVALTKDNLKERLAYSTISQLSYIVLGAALAHDLGILGGSMHIAMHAVGKITLFFCAGAIMVASHKTEISQMDGLGRRMPFTYFAFFLGSLAIIGLPPTGGAWSKWYLSLGAASSHQTAMMTVLMISAFLSIGYLMPVVARGFFRPLPADDHHGHGEHGDHSDHGDHGDHGHGGHDARGHGEGDHGDHHDAAGRLVRAYPAGSDADAQEGYAGPLVPVGQAAPRWSWSQVQEAPLMCVAPLMITGLGCVALFLLSDPLYQLLLPLTSGDLGAVTHH